MVTPFGVDGIYEQMKTNYFESVGWKNLPSPNAAFITHDDKASLCVKKDFLPLEDSEKRISTKFELFQKFNIDTLTCRR